MSKHHHPTDLAPHRSLKRHDRRTQLLTVTGHVRSIELTPLGHLSCVLDTQAGRLKALSDAASVHLPELRAGTRVQAVLLRLSRATPDALWHWQLLCCRPTPLNPAPATNLVAATEGSQA